MHLVKVLAPLLDLVHVAPELGGAQAFQRLQEALHATQRLDDGGDRVEEPVFRIASRRTATATTATTTGSITITTSITTTAATTTTTTTIIIIIIITTTITTATTTITTATTTTAAATTAGAHVVLDDKHLFHKPGRHVQEFAQAFRDFLGVVAKQECAQV